MRAALVATVSASQACEFHNMTAKDHAKEVVAMSTAQPPTIAEEAATKAAAKECAAGAKDCPETDK